MDDKPTPTLTAKALADKQAREAREAAALRANLARRKQQQRAREDSKEESSFSEEKEAKRLSSS